LTGTQPGERHIGPRDGECAREGDVPIPGEQCDMRLRSVQRF
jgi:hypothetical protein